MSALALQLSPAVTPSILSTITAIPDPAEHWRTGDWDLPQGCVRATITLPLTTFTTTIGCPTPTTHATAPVTTVPPNPTVPDLPITSLGSGSPGPSHTFLNTGFPILLVASVFITGWYISRWAKNKRLDQENPDRRRSINLWTYQPPPRRVPVGPPCEGALRMAREAAEREAEAARDQGAASSGRRGAVVEPALPEEAAKKAGSWERGSKSGKAGRKGSEPVSPTGGVMFNENIWRA
jgi:hypothetical protein